MLEVRAKECTYKGKTLLAEKETSEKQEKLCERLLFPPFLSPSFSAPWDMTEEE